jgi:hypothetical protein
VATHADDIMGSPTLRTLQESMLLPWVCFRGSAFGGGFPNPGPLFGMARAGVRAIRHGGV